MKDCAIAPVGTTGFANQGDPAPAGYSDCVAGDLHTRDYGLLIDGEKSEYWGSGTANWLLQNGNHVATADGGARAEFLIDNWAGGLDLYTKGGVTGPELPPTDGETPVDGLPNTGVGPAAKDDAVPSLALLVASGALGYVSYRTVRSARS